MSHSTDAAREAAGSGGVLPVLDGRLPGANWKLPVPKFPGKFKLLPVPKCGLKRGGCLALLFAACLGAACTSKPPANPDNICDVFAEKPAWYKAARKAQSRWQLPIGLGMAFVHRESSYIADAQPPRGKVLWVIPWRRPSSAYGYAQATDEAWQDYLDDVGGWFVERDDLGDALDFIGWYNDRSHHRLRLAKDDAYRLYLAYYEGQGGYSRGSWRNKPQVKGYARKVADRTRRYTTQLASCEKKLSRRGWFF